MGGYVSQLVRSVLLRAEIDRLARAAVHDHGELLARADNDRGPLHDLLAAFEREIPTLLPQLDACMAEVH